MRSGAGSNGEAISDDEKTNDSCNLVVDLMCRYFAVMPKMNYKGEERSGDDGGEDRWRAAGINGQLRGRICCELVGLLKEGEEIEEGENLGR